jgi:hypothetical protein
MAGVGTLSSGAITTTGVLTVPAGTVSAPAITTTGDTNTGIFFPAADTIAFTEGGTEAMRITSAGAVGIGTNSPVAARLQVTGTGTTALSSVQNTDSFAGGNNFTQPHFVISSGNDTTGNVTRLGMGVGTGGQVFLDALMENSVTVYSSLLFRTRGPDGMGERMRITSTGLVGIGTNNPSESLTIASGNIGGQDNLNLKALATNTNGTVVNINSTGTVGVITMTTNSAERMRINSSGGVSIGTTANTGRLTIFSTYVAPSYVGNGQLVLASSDARTVDAGGTIQFGGSYTGSVYSGFAAIKGALEGAVNAGYMAFYTEPNTGELTERMRIDSSGNVGIGFVPVASTYRTLQLSFSGNGLIVPAANDMWLTSNANFNGGWTYGATGTATAYEQVSGLHVWFGAASGTAGAGITLLERMRIDSSGNLGIGTSSPGSRLTLAGVSGNSAISFVAPDATVKSYIGVTAAGNYITGAAAGETFIRSDGVGIAFSANTGSSVQMRIASSGNVGIGTSSPNQKLRVENNANSSTWVNIANPSGGNGAGSGVLFTTDQGDAGAVFQNSSGNADGAGGNSLRIRNLLNAPIGFEINASERMRIATTGNVGIGTGGPEGRLELFGNDSSTTTIGVKALVTNYNTTTGTRAGIAFRNFDNYGASIWSPRTGSTAGVLVFGTNNETGTAETNITEKMRITSTGSVGIGTTTPRSQMMVLGSNQTTAAITDAGGQGGSLTLAMNSGASGSGGALLFAALNDNSTYVPQWAIKSLLVNGSGNGIGSLAFSTRASGTDTSLTERMRLDSSGNLLVGTTAISGVGGFSIRPNLGGAGTYCRLVLNSNGTNDVFDFQQNGTQVGRIQIAATQTFYVTTSDYRLKENIAPMTGALAKVTQLNPCTYTWKSNGSSGQGFIAHELAEVCPEAVVGKKDEVNEDGSINPQGIDTSFLVATLAAAIQELKATVDAQAARIAVLESK